MSDLGIPAPPRIGITTAPLVGDHGPAVQIERAYARAVLQAGGLPLLLPVLEPDRAALALAAIDGLVLAGGGDIDPAQYGAVAEPEVAGVDAERDAWELALVREARIPILGVCRGAQVINVARGGTLVQDLPKRTSAEHRLIDRPEEEVHVVALTEGSRLREAVGVDQVVANTLHHQSVDQLGTGLRVVGWADDGTVEAIEADDGPLLGVQWHPELLRDRLPHLRLFEWLVQAAGPRPAQPVPAP